MGRRPVGPLDSLLESWAFWCEGDSRLLGTGLSMLARLIDGKGEILFGASTPGSSQPHDAMETRLESIVVAMASESQDRADVLRLEYSAGWWNVCKRRQIRAYDPRGTDQMMRAHALGMSLRTYKRRLAEARAVIETKLKESP